MCESLRLRVFDSELITPGVYHIMLSLSMKKLNFVGFGDKNILHWRSFSQDRKSVV